MQLRNNSVYSLGLLKRKEQDETPNSKLQTPNEEDHLHVRRGSEACGKVPNG